MYIGIINSTGHNFKKFFTEEELKNIQKRRKEMRQRLLKYSS